MKATKNGVSQGPPKNPYAEHRGLPAEKSTGPSVGLTTFAKHYVRYKE